jgi:REP-associated tyrosine transposase
MSPSRKNDTTGCGDVADTIHGGHCFVSALTGQCSTQRIWVATKRCPPIQTMNEQSSYWHVGRKHPVHNPTVESGNQAIVVFVTVNTCQRKPILAGQEAVQAMLRAWREADTWLVGRYVIMPDHIHFFCAPRDRSVNLRRWVKCWKSQVSLRWPRPAEQPVWQLDFWDTQLRRDENYDEKWDYVWRNPVRKGLVAKPEDWPYAGEINILAWHER